MVAPLRNRWPSTAILCPTSSRGGLPPLLFPPRWFAVGCLRVAPRFWGFRVLSVRFHDASPGLLFSATDVGALGWGLAVATLFLGLGHRPHIVGWVACSPCLCLPCAQDRRQGHRSACARGHPLVSHWPGGGANVVRLCALLFTCVPNRKPKPHLFALYVAIPGSVVACGRTRLPFPKALFLSRCRLLRHLRMPPSSCIMPPPCWTVVFLHRCCREAMWGSLVRLCVTAIACHIAF